MQKGKAKKGYENKRKEAEELRKLGLSRGDISKKLNISPSSAKIYTKDIQLTDKQKNFLKSRTRKSSNSILNADGTFTRKCSFPECKRKHCAKGLCYTHRAQQKKYGKLFRTVNDETKEERFWRQIKKSKEKDGCWTWTSSSNRKDGDGYGVINYNSKSQLAHRFSYELHKGKILKGMSLDHLCRNRMCVNPDHLEIVTHAENIKRMMAYHTMLTEVNRLRNLVQELGGDPGAKFFI
jgi:predicted transcriptional regulator